MGTLTGKTAVVTGSTSGIGLAYARAFAGAGANIVHQRLRRRRPTSRRSAPRSRPTSRSRRSIRRPT